MGVCVVNFFLEEINVKPCTFTGMGALSQSGDEVPAGPGPGLGVFPACTSAHFLSRPLQQAAVHHLAEVPARQGPEVSGSAASSSWPLSVAPLAGH